MLIEVTVGIVSVQDPFQGFWQNSRAAELKKAACQLVFMNPTSANCGTLLAKCSLLDLKSLLVQRSMCGVSFPVSGSSTDISEDWEKDFDLDMTEEEVQLALAKVDVSAAEVSPRDSPMQLRKS